MTQLRAAATREEIARAAAAEFDELGYAAASLSSIAARLGKTKGAMSYHFSSKASIAREVVDMQYRQWPPILARIRRDGHSGLAVMVILSFVLARRFRDDVLVRAGVRLQHDAGLRTTELPTPYLGWLDVTRALLAEGQSAGQLSPAVDLGSAAEVLVEAFTGMQQVAQRLTKASDIDARVRNYWKMLLPGLGVTDTDRLVDELGRAAAAY